MKWFRLLPIALVVFLLAACGSDQIDLIGEWTGTESSGGGGTVTFRENETVLIEMGFFNNSFEWTVEDNTLNLYTTKDGQQELAYQYEVEQEDQENITLYELDEDGNRVEGATIKLSK